MKKIISVFLMVVFALTLIPADKEWNIITAKATEENWYFSDVTEMADGSHSGTVEGDVTWVLDEEGMLTVNGTGVLCDYFIERTSYLSEHRLSITKIIVCEGITKIGKEAFYKCENAVSVDLPDSLEEFGSGAFAFCLRLASVEIPDKVTVLPMDLFFSDYSITSIKLPSNLKKICWQALLCQNLQQIEIPASVEEIERGAFYGCGLQFVYFRGTQQQWERIVDPENNEVLEQAKIIFEYDENEVYELDGGYCGAEDEKSVRWVINSANELIISGSGKMKDYFVDSGNCFPCCPWNGSPLYNKVETIIVEDGITFITYFAFFGSSAKKVVLSDSLTHCDGSVFLDCFSITEINIPDSLEADQFFFSHLTNLEKVVVSGSCKNYFVGENGEIYSKRIYSDTLLIELAYIPNTVKRLKIPVTVKSIDYQVLKAQLRWSMWRWLKITLPVFLRMAFCMRKKRMAPMSWFIALLKFSVKL